MAKISNLDKSTHSKSETKKWGGGKPILRTVTLSNNEGFMTSRALVPGRQAPHHVDDF